METHGNKRELRQHMLALLRAVPAEQREADSAILRAKLVSLLGSSSPLTVGIYLPLQHEVNLLPLLQEYPQHLYAAPRCLAGRQLCFHRITNIAEDTAPGSHGILAPHAHLPIVSPQEMDILIIPGVAYTEQGARLGYGGGYYDRYLPQCTRTQTVALAFALQMLPHIPTETHDFTLPNIIHL